MSIEDRQIELELITSLEDKAIKDTAILDLKRKWEREDSSSSGVVLALIIVAVIACGGYFLGSYCAQQNFVKDLQKIASIEHEPGQTYEKFYYSTWDYLYDNYKVNLN